MPCRGPSKAAAEPRLTEERSKAEIFSALRRSDENQVLLPAARVNAESLQDAEKSRPTRFRQRILPPSEARMFNVLLPTPKAKGSRKGGLVRKFT